MSDHSWGGVKGDVSVEVVSVEVVPNEWVFIIGLTP